MIKKITIILFIILCGIACSGHSGTIFLNNNYDHKLIYKSALCDSKKSFPQMILIPYFNQASQIVPNCDTYPVHQTALALFVFYHQWLENFGDQNMEIRGILEKVMIEWDTEKRIGKKGFNLEGERFKDRPILGVVKSPSMIWVWQGYNHKISESALFHELVHLAIRAKNGKHGDPDHEGHKYRGWTTRHSHMIIESKQMLRAFGL